MLYASVRGLLLVLLLWFSYSSTQVLLHMHLEFMVKCHADAGTYSVCDYMTPYYSFNYLHLISSTQSGCETKYTLTENKTTRNVNCYQILIRVSCSLIPCSGSKDCRRVCMKYIGSFKRTIWSPIPNSMFQHLAQLHATLSNIIKLANLRLVTAGEKTVWALQPCSI